MLCLSETWHIDVFKDVESEFDNSFLKICPKNNSLKQTFIKGVFEVADSELGNYVFSNSIPKTPLWANFALKLKSGLFLLKLGLKGIQGCWF